MNEDKRKKLYEYYIKLLDLRQEFSYFLVTELPEDMAKGKYTWLAHLDACLDGAEYIELNSENDTLEKHLFDNGIIDSAMEYIPGK